MGSPEIKAGEGTLKKAADMVVSAKGDFDTMSKNLLDDLQAQKMKWQGQGGAAFQQLAQAWHDKQRIIVGALNEFEQALVSTDKDNVNTDQNQSTAVLNNRNRLDGVQSY